MSKELEFTLELFLFVAASFFLMTMQTIDLYLGILLKAATFVSVVLVIIIHWKTIKEKFKIK